MSYTENSYRKGVSILEKQYSVTISKIIEELSLTVVFMPENGEERTVVSSEVSRPGLGLSGYFEYFDNNRVQVMGKSEFGFLNSIPKEKSIEQLRQFLSQKPPMLVVSRSL